MLSLYKKKIFLLILLLLFTFKTNSQTVCDNYLTYTSRQMQNFTSNAYNPMRLNNIWGYLNVLEGYVQATYQSCFGKIIIDPDSIYPRDITECMVGLYNTSLLAASYTGNFAKIKSNLDGIAKIIFSTVNNCRPVLGYKGWSNLSNQCKTNINLTDGLFQNYQNQIILGGNGFKYVNDMILSSQKIRKSCGFDVLVKAKSWSNDNCSAANNNWMYPLIDSLDNMVHQQKDQSFIEGFYNLYQTLYRVKSICKITEFESYSQQNNLISE